MMWLFHKVIVLQIIKALSNNLTIPSVDAFRPFELISRAHPVITKIQNPIFAIMVTINYWRVLLLFAILLLCKITTTSREHTYKALRLPYIFARIERKTPVLRPALQPKQTSSCGLHRSGNRGCGGPNGQIVSVKTAADGRRQRGQKIIDGEREKYRAKNGSLRNTSTDSKKTTLVILRNHTGAPVRKKRSSSRSKARRKASRNQFVEKGGMSDRVKSFREIDSRQDRPRARPGFVKPIRNGLRKIKNLM